MAIKTAVERSVGIPHAPACVSSTLRAGVSAWSEPPSLSEFAGLIAGLEAYLRAAQEAERLENNVW